MRCKAKVTNACSVGMSEKYGVSAEKGAKTQQTQGGGCQAPGREKKLNGCRLCP